VLSTLGQGGPLRKGPAMKRTLVSALLPLVATSLLVTGSASSGGAEENGSCALPTAERSYTRDQLVYRLALDLTDCAWWDGSPVHLDGSIERVEPTGDHGAGSSILCGTTVALPIAESGEGPGDTETDEHMPSPKARTSSTGMRSGACAVEVSIDHPSPEAAQYRGEITFPWEGDRRTVSFNALCSGNAGGCVDLPADPITLLAPALAP
jgi:hypothetical protein